MLIVLIVVGLVTVLQDVFVCVALWECQGCVFTVQFVKVGSGESGPLIDRTAVERREWGDRERGDMQQRANSGIKPEALWKGLLYQLSLTTPQPETPRRQFESCIMITAFLFTDYNTTVTYDIISLMSLWFSYQLSAISHRKTFSPSIIVLLQWLPVCVPQNSNIFTTCYWQS